jgi:hypothetical protein
VEDDLALGNGNMTVELYPITGSAHASTLLMAYLPP